MSRQAAHVLDNEAQRSVLRGDCYYCWLGQYDKCDSNCNNKRAVPKYGNHDITPTGKFKLKTSIGSQSHTEWLTTQQGAAANQADSIAGRRGNGQRSGSIGVGGQSGRLSRFEILQEQRRSWALRDPLADPPPKLASLSAGDAGDDGPGFSLTNVSYYGGGGNDVLATKNYAKKQRDHSTERDRPSHLVINSCRLPKQAEIPHKHAAGAVRVQITPYSFAEIASRSSLLADERQKANEGKLKSEIRNEFIEHQYDHRSDVARQAAGEEAFGVAQRHQYQSFEQHQQNYHDYILFHGESSVANQNRRVPSSGRAVSRSGPRGKSHSVQSSRRAPSVQLGKGGVVLHTQAPTAGGGPLIKVRSDDTSSYILTHKVQSVRNMPLPELFQGLD